MFGVDALWERGALGGGWVHSQMVLGAGFTCLSVGGGGALRFRADLDQWCLLGS